MKTFDEIFAGLPGTGWLTEQEARLLWDAVGATDGPILEVGSYHGRSTCLLASLGRMVYAVDPFAGFDTADPSGDKIEESFRANLAARGLEEYVTLFRQRIEEWTPRSVGFAYLDGDHDGAATARQIEVALACQPQVIAIHDVSDHGGGVHVQKVAQRLLGNRAIRTGRLAVWQVGRKS